MMNNAAEQPSIPLVCGDQALAQGALAAGVRVVTGYPGSPATGVFEALLGATDPSQVHVQWAPNEKVAMEIAFGASLGGLRALVVLKSVGLNIALDPLATMSLSGCHAGLVILLGDDPGGWGSQNEQDTRWLARVAEVPIVEPINVEQAAALMVQAFTWSESVGIPVILRIVGAMATGQSVIEPPWQLPPREPGFFRKRNRWVVLPATVVPYHRALHRQLCQVRELFEASPYDVSCGEGRVGVIAVGYTYTKLLATAGTQASRFRILGLSSVWPLPERGLGHWLSQVDRVLVLEEGNPFVEEELAALAQRLGLEMQICGRHDGAIPEEGELTERDIDGALARLDAGYLPMQPETTQRAMPSRVPLCEDCPYRPTFEALLSAVQRHGGRERHIIVGETGCMVRANLPPFELFDVKYGLGSGLGLGIGLALNNAAQRVVALIGDSSFFHTDINAMPYVAQLNLPMLVVVLDNGTTALTGGQAHPGSAADERGRPRPMIDLADVIRGCGIEPTVCPTQDRAALEAAFDEALGADATRVIIARGPCPRYVR